MTGKLTEPNLGITDFVFEDEGVIGRVASGERSGRCGHRPIGVRVWKLWIGRKPEVGVTRDAFL